MKRVVVVLIAMGVLAAGGALAWFYSSGNEAPSTDLAAPPINGSPAATVDATDDTVPVDSTTDPATAGSSTYVISSDDSLVIFTLQEELRGVDTKAVGSTGQVAGEILVDFDNPAASVLGDVVVNARTFTTDSSNRNRAVRGAILDTDTFEFITFSPTSIDGLPSEPTDSFTFTVIGDLTIRDVTQSVTFDVEVSSAADRVEGSASTIVNRTDFGIVVPSVPFVANVSEDVTLSIEFVALPG